MTALCMRVGITVGLMLGSVLGVGCQPVDGRPAASAATAPSPDGRGADGQESKEVVQRLHEQARAERSLARFLELLSTSPRLQRVKFMTEDEEHELPWDEVQAPLAEYADAARKAERRMAELSRAAAGGAAPDPVALDEARGDLARVEVLRGRALRLTMELVFQTPRVPVLITAETGEEYLSDDRESDDGPHPSAENLQPRRANSERARLINEMIEMYPQAKLDRAMVAFLEEVFVYRLGPRPGGGDQELNDRFHDYISTANAGPQVTIAAFLTRDGLSDIEGGIRWLRRHMPELARERPRLLRGLLEKVGGVTDETALHEVETGLPPSEPAPSDGQ